jgi:hypothetical protein
MPPPASTRDARELDRLLWASRDALPTRLASRRLGRVGGVPSVGHALQLAEHTELGEVGVVDPPNLEDVEWTHLDAIGLPLALGAVDNGREFARIRPTLGGRTHGGLDDRTKASVPPPRSPVARARARRMRAPFPVHLATSIRTARSASLRLTPQGHVCDQTPGCTGTSPPYARACATDFGLRTAQAADVASDGPRILRDNVWPHVHARTSMRSESGHWVTKSRTRALAICPTTRSSPQASAPYDRPQRPHGLATSPFRIDDGFDLGDGLVEDHMELLDGGRG